MKKWFYIPLLLLALLSQTACGDNDEEPIIPEQPETPAQPGDGDDNDDEPDKPTPGGNGKYLVLYCSRTSNTGRVAQQIRTTLDCDMLEVEPETPYDNDYNSMLSHAQTKLAAIRQGNYPPIKTFIENFDAYDLVFVGYPIWHGSMATPMQTFLHEHAAKLAGKRIALFATSGSSGISTSVGEARVFCSEAEFTETLHLTNSTLPQMAGHIAAWLEQLNLNKDKHDDDMKTNTLSLTVGDKTFTATLAENSSVEALKERLAQGPLTVRMSDYGDMEKVGPLGFSLPRNDVSITTAPGDLILYQGSSLVIYYDINSWSFTRLGKVDGVTTREQMLDLLGGAGDITLTLSLQKK